MIQQLVTYALKLSPEDLAMLVDLAARLDKKTKEMPE
jgi:hypothetical protein